MSGTINKENSKRKSPSFEISGAEVGEVLPTIKSVERGPFLYAWNKNCWHVMKGKLVPRIRIIPITPGLNGISWKRKSKQFDVVNMRAKMLERGWNILDRSLGPEGDYLVEEQSFDGPIILSAWEFAQDGTNRVVVDEEGYVEWLYNLVEDGVIEKCPRYILDEMRSNKLSEIVSYQSEANKMKDELVLNQMKEDLKVIEEELAKHEKVSAPKVNRKNRKSPSTF